MNTTEVKFDINIMDLANKESKRKIKELEKKIKLLERGNTTLINKADKLDSLRHWYSEIIDQFDDDLFKEIVDDLGHIVYKVNQIKNAGHYLKTRKSNVKKKR